MSLRCRRLLLILVETEGGAEFSVRCIGANRVVALNTGSFAVGFAKLGDARLTAKLLLAVLRRQNILQRRLRLRTPSAGLWRLNLLDGRLLASAAPTFTVH